MPINPVYINPVDDAAEMIKGGISLFDILDKGDFFSLFSGEERNRRYKAETKRLVKILYAREAEKTKMEDEMRLPPYDPDAKCPKCGNGDVESRHLPECSDSILSRSKWGHSLKECVGRSCKNCHYGWPEACADHDVAQKICDEANAKLAKECRGYGKKCGDLKECEDCDTAVFEDCSDEQERREAAKKAEVNDSVLDDEIPYELMYFVVNQKGACRNAFGWYCECLEEQQGPPSWNDLLRDDRIRKTDYAEWVVDNLADHIPNNIIAALKAKLNK